MRSVVWCFLLCLLRLSSFGQSGKVDSVTILLIAHQEEDTARVNLLNELSFQNISVNYYKVREHAEQALHLAERLHYNKGIAIANIRLSRASWSLGENDEAVEYALRAEDIIKKDKLGSELLSECYQTLGFAYLDLNELARAEFYFRTSERIFRPVKKTSFLFRTYLGLLRVKYFQNQVDSIPFYEEKCVRVIKENSDSFNEALLIYFKSYEIKNPKLAEDAFFRTLAFAQAVGNKYVETMSLIMLGVNFLREGNYAEAEKYTQRSLQMSRTIGIKNMTLQSYQLLVDLTRQRGRIDEALAYQKAYYELQDSISNGRKTRQVIELETKYEKEKREQEIRILTEQSRADAILKYSLTIGLIVVIVSSVLIYSLQRSRAKQVQEFLNLQKSINEKLKETDLLKSRFFANISHEFRTPLSLIISPMQERLRVGNLSEEDSKLFRLALRNSNQLLTLVNEMLDLSKLEAKKMELRVQQGDLDRFMTLLVASFDSLAESKRIHFEKKISLTKNGIWFDKEKLEKIINNLLFNAFKFTAHDGKIQLNVSDESGHLDIVIVDNGKGIPKEDQLHVFESFYQVQQTADDRPAGTGLGLALVKELVSLYHGHIKLESSVGKGTTIFVTLPTEKANFKHAQFIEALPLNDVNLEPVDFSKDTFDDFHDLNDADQILIVDDNPDLRSFIASTMSSRYSILTAKDGEEGWQMAIEHTPNLVISDVMMPNLDGISLAEKIKGDERTSHIPIVLLTAKADLESRVVGLKTGADDYLVKPFSTEELSVRVNNLIEQRKKLIAKFRSKLKFPIESGPVEASLDEKFLIKVRKVIENNFGDPAFGVNQFADEMNMSRTNIFRKLKAIVGLSPNELINDVRLQRAAEMIQGKVDTLAQISYAVGFNDQSYFSKRFKKKFGVTPSEYTKD